MVIFNRHLPIEDKINLCDLCVSVVKESCNILLILSDKKGANNENESAGTQFESPGRGRKQDGMEIAMD